MRDCYNRVVSKGQLQLMRSRLFGGVSHLFWPGVCLNCGCSTGDDGGVLCRACWENLMEVCGGEYCRRCGCERSVWGSLAEGCERCQGERIHFDGIARGGIYRDVLCDLILEYKLSGRVEYNELLGVLCVSALIGSGFADDVEFVEAVPMHWSRRILRGYNQSSLLASCVLKGINNNRRIVKGKSTLVRLSRDLVRVRRTKRQTLMSSAMSRARNVEGAFAVRRGHFFEGRVVCLVDDIKTTGATLNECARVLKAAGAKKVYAVVCAVAGQRDEERT